MLEVEIHREFRKCETCESFTNLGGEFLLMANGDTESSLRTLIRLVEWENQLPKKRDVWVNRRVPNL